MRRCWREGGREDAYTLSRLSSVAAWPNESLNSLKRKKRRLNNRQSFTCVASGVGGMTLACWPVAPMDPTGPKSPGGPGGPCMGSGGQSAHAHMAIASLTHCRPCSSICAISAVNSGGTLLPPRPGPTRFSLKALTHARRRGHHSLAGVRHTCGPPVVPVCPAVRGRPALLLGPVCARADTSVKDLKLILTT